MKLCIAAVFVLAASTASAEPSAAEHYETGKALFARADYANAAKEFAAAHAADPEPKYIYNLAQAQRLAGNCEAAVVAYRAFLATNPPAARGDVARAGIDKCAAAAGEPSPAPGSTAATRDKPASPSSAATRDQPAPPSSAATRDKPAPPSSAATRDEPATTPLDKPVPPTAPVEQRPLAPVGPPRVRTEQPGTAPIVSARDPWYRDVFGDVLTGTGCAFLVASGVLYAKASSAASRTHDDGTLDDFIAARSSASRLQGFTLISGSVGIALVTGGLIRYALRPSHERVVVVPSATASGAGVLVEGRF